MSVIVISSGGVNPSNRGAEFPNLARTPISRDREAHKDIWNPDVVLEVTETCKSELRAAGIDIHEYAWMHERAGEVPSNAVGGIKGWSFKRAWYYWVCTGPALPPEYAVALYKAHGKKVRVEGHAGGPDPLEYCHGFGVGCYHVDSPEGLRALADMVKHVYENGAKEYQTRQKFVEWRIGAYELLRNVASVFRHYETLHKDKGTPEGTIKAKRNGDMAQLCEDKIREYSE